MNLRDLRYLIALADLRHFGHAAEACHVSQPTLSTQIRKLEEELGVALVERAPRHVMLTPVGVDIVERARRVLADVEQMREMARRTTDPEAGSVRLGIFPTLGPYLLPHVVPKIRARFPKLELLLIEEKTSVLLGMLRAGQLDAAVLALPLHEDWLETQFLFEEPFMLAVPGDHPLASHKHLQLAELVGPEPAAARGRPLPSRPGARSLQPGRRRREGGIPGHQPGNAATDGCRRRRHHPAANAGDQAARAESPTASSCCRSRTRRRAGAWPWCGGGARPWARSCDSWLACSGIFRRSCCGRRRQRQGSPGRQEAGVEAPMTSRFRPDLSFTPSIKTIKTINFLLSGGGTMLGRSRQGRGPFHR